MVARVQLWWTILAICIAERLVYRGDFVLGTMMRFLPIVTQIFLWTAVFAGGRRRSPATPRNDVVAYYLLTMIARAFSSMPGLASGIARQIRDGEIKKFLIQPIDLIGFSLLARMGHKLVYYGVAIVPFAAGVLPVPRLLSAAGRRATYLAAFVAVARVVVSAGFFLEISLGLVGFWLLEISSLLFVYMLFNFFFSGHMFPLDSCPSRGGRSVELMPLKYLAYFRRPCSWRRFRRTGCGSKLASKPSWVVFFIVLSRVLIERRLPPLQRLWRVGQWHGVSSPTQHETTAPVLRRVSHVRAEQPRARHDVPRELPHRAGLQLLVVAHEPGVLHAGLQPDGPRGPAATSPAGRKYEFFVFIATTIFVNSLVEAFFMANAEELSELTRTGGLDFALLKPIDTQFLVSLRKINWSSARQVRARRGAARLLAAANRWAPTHAAACRAVSVCMSCWAR